MKLTVLIFASGCLYATGVQQYPYDFTTSLTSNYLSTTQNIMPAVTFPPPAVSPTLGSIGDSGFRVTFSTLMNLDEFCPLSEPESSCPTGWWTWNHYPYSEYTAASQDGTPFPVLETREASMTMTLSRPVTIFGFEVEPVDYQVFQVSASFYDPAGQLLITISQNLNGYAGSALYAVTADAGIGSVLVTTDDISDPTGNGLKGGFGIAAIRTDVPEPATILLVGALVALKTLFRRQRVPLQ